MAKALTDTDSADLVLSFLKHVEQHLNYWNDYQNQKTVDGMRRMVSPSLFRNIGHKDPSEWRSLMLDEVAEVYKRKCLVVAELAKRGFDSLGSEVELLTGLLDARNDFEAAEAKWKKLKAPLRDAADSIRQGDAPCSEGVENEGVGSAETAASDELCPLELNANTSSVICGGTPITIREGGDFKMLKMLWDAPAHSSTYADLLGELKPGLYGPDTKVSEAPEEIRSSLSRNRAALKKSGCGWTIQAIRGKGYALIPASK